MPDIKFIDISAEMHEDPRGMSLFLWQGRVRNPQDLMQTFHLVSINPGQIRGNHLHPGHEEWLYLFHGTGVLTWDQPPGEINEQVISGNRTMIHIPPGVAHALRNPGPEVLYLVAWREAAGPGPREPETVPRVIKQE